MTIVKKWEIEKGKGYTVFIGAHVVQKGEKCSVNKYIVRYRITPYFIQSYKCSSSYFRKCLTIFTWIYRQLIFVNTDFTGDCNDFCFKYFLRAQHSYVNRSCISTEYSVVQNCQCSSCVKAHNIVLICKQTFVYCRRFCYCDKSVKDKYPTMHCSFSLPSGTICNQCKNPVLLLTLK